MIKIHKSPLPDGVGIKREEDYRGGVVFKLLVADCRSKCYICEDSVHTAPNVEHRIPHRGDSALKYSWDNLLLACAHCNNTKLDKYEAIIDPTKTDPEQFIKLSLDVDDELREMVTVQKRGGASDVDLTIDLLNAVYNGTKTDMKKYACQQLKNKISNELIYFRQKLDDYKAAPTDDKLSTIKQNLSDRSIFAAFKRDIVQSDSALRFTSFAE